MSNKNNKLIAAIKHNPGIFFYEKFTMEDLFTLSKVSTYFKDKLQKVGLKAINNEWTKQSLSFPEAMVIL